MTHIMYQGNSNDVILSLHGTGGSEHDLIGLSKRIAPDATHIGLLGNVLERGMRRFFKRISPGVFDEESLIIETKDILLVIESLKKTYQLEHKTWHVLGYSNGANMASSLIFHKPDLFKKAFLFHPMKPYKTFEYQASKHLEVFIAAGRNDPIVTQEETLGLIDIYDRIGASIETIWSSEGHQISMLAVNAAHQFMIKEKG